MYRLTPQTENCKKYEKETIKCPSSSNFISHSSKCKSIPAEHAWAAYEAQRVGTDGEAVSVSSVASLSGVATSTSGLEAQHLLMDSFSAHGLQNPAKVVMSKGF
jgi:hypothetical protein